MKIQYGFIYITTNNINGKRYIGQCKYQQNRDWQTYLGSGTILKKAIKKYGKENFSREIICNAFSREELSELELHFILEYDAVNRTDFYNMAEGGYATRGFLGKTHTEEYKEKMKEFSANRPATDKMRENMANVGKLPRTESQTLASKKQAIKMGLANKGKSHSSETLLEMSISRSGKNNARSLIWTLEDESGSIFTIECLKQWCSERSIIYKTLGSTFKTKKFHKNFRVIDKRSKSQLPEKI